MPLMSLCSSLLALLFAFLISVPARFACASVLFTQGFYDGAMPQVPFAVMPANAPWTSQSLQRVFVATQRGGLTDAGSIVELLILIPFRFAINSRRHNISLRMLGLIINRVDDPKKLAPLLKDTFLSVVLDKPQFKVSNEQ